METCGHSLGTSIDAGDTTTTVCLDIHFLTESSSYSYELGQCFAPRQYIGQGTYTDKCCLDLTEEHILTCKTSESSGWAHSYLMIKDHWFCDDIVGYKSMSRIDMSGIRIYTQKNIIYDKFLTEVNNQAVRLLVGLIAPTTSVQTTGIFYCILKAAFIYIYVVNETTLQH